MVEERVDLKFARTGDAEVRSATREVRSEVDGLNKATQEQSASAGQAAEASSGLSSSMVATGVAIAGAVIAIREIIGAAKEMALEFDRQVSIMNRFQGNIDGVGERIGGLISDIDLMTAANKAQQAGLNLTASQMGDIATAAIEMAAATGEDGKAAFDRLTQSIAMGSTRALKQLGIDLENTSDLAAVQQEALEKLAIRQAGVTSQADTLAGSMTRVSATIDNLTTEFIAGVDSSNAYEDALRDLGSATLEMSDAFIPLGETVWPTATEAGEVFSTMIQTLATRLAAVIRLMTAVQTWDWEGVKRQLGEFTSDVAGARGGLATVASQAEVAQQKRERERGLRDALLRSAGTAVLALGNQRIEDAASRRGGGGRGARGTAEVRAAAEAEAALNAEREERVDLVRTLIDLEHELDQAQREAAEEASRSLQKESETRRAIYEQRRAAEREQYEIQEFNRQREEQFAREQNQRVQAGIGIAQQAGEVALNVFEAGQGEKEFFYGLFEAARAAGTAFVPGLQLEAIGHGISSAAHFANAAKLGFGGGSAPPRGAAGGGGGGSRPSDVRGAGGGSAPLSGPTTINVMMPNVVATEADQARLIDQIMARGRAEGVIRR